MVHEIGPVLVQVSHQADPKMRIWIQECLREMIAERSKVVGV
jgi:hypothetical protein